MPGQQLGSGSGYTVPSRHENDAVTLSTSTNDNFCQRERVSLGIAKL